MEGYTLLYDGNNPNKIVPAFGDNELYRLYREGYRKVPFSRVGHKLKISRRKLNLSPDDMINKLEDVGVFVSLSQYRKIEQGRAPASIQTVAFLVSISKLLATPLAHLVAPRPRKNEKKEERPNE